MAEHRQTKCRFGNKYVAWHGFERRTCRVAATLVIAGHDGGDAFPAHDDLRRTEHMAGGCKCYLDTVVNGGFAVARRLHRTRECLTIAHFHDGEGFAGGEDRAVAGARMIAMAMRDHRARHRPHRIDDEISGNTT